MSKTYYLKDGYPVKISADQFVVCFPAGGGFQHRIPLEKFLEDFQKDQPEPVMRAALFSIDDGPEFEGFHKGDRWNGWACPYFTHEVALQIAEHTNTEPDYQLVFDKDADVWKWVTVDDVDDEPWEFERQTIVVNGEEISVFAIGAYGWVWDVTELEEK